MLELGGLELTVRVTDKESVVENVRLEEVLSDGGRLCVPVGEPRRVPEIVPVSEGGLELDTVLDAHWSAVGDCSWETLGVAVGVAPGVPESGGLADAAAEGETVVLKLWTLADVCGELLGNCVKVPAIEPELLSVCMGDRVVEGVPDVATVTEGAEEAVRALLNVPTGLTEF